MFTEAKQKKMMHAKFRKSGNTLRKYCSTLYAMTIEKLCRTKTEFHCSN